MNSPCGNCSSTLRSVILESTVEPTPRPTPRSVQYRERQYQAGSLGKVNKALQRRLRLVGMQNQQSVKRVERVEEKMWIGPQAHTAATGDYGTDWER